jgi:hypothetical protein
MIKSMGSDWWRSWMRATYRLADGRKQRFKKRRVKEKRSSSVEAAGLALADRISTPSAPGKGPGGSAPVMTVTVWPLATNSLATCETTIPVEEGRARKTFTQKTTFAMNHLLSCSASIANSAGEVRDGRKTFAVMRD